MGYRVVQHFAIADSIGGPAAQLRLLMKSPIMADFEFYLCSQNRPAGGINLPLIREMAAEIRKWNPHLVHVRGLQNEGFHGVLAAKLAGCQRILVSVHGFAGDSIQSSPWKKALFSCFIEPLTLRLASAVVCVCNYQSQHPLIRRWAKNFRGVIYNAAPTYSMAVDREHIRRTLGFLPTDVVSTTVARLTVDKGLADLADAIHMPQITSNSQLRFLIVGDGEYADTFQSKCVKEIGSGKVIMTGVRKDIEGLLSASDTFVFPSLHENFSNCLLEAGAAGLPVIATAVGGNPEIVENGQTGILVPPHDPEALAEAITNLATNISLRQYFGRKLQQHIKINFNEAVVFRKYSALYRELIEVGG